MIDSQAFNQQFTENDTPDFGKTYLFYGQTPFLSEENAQILVKSAKNNGFSQREIFYIDNRSKFLELSNTLQSPGLFDPKKIIELRFDTDKPTKKIGEQVLHIAKHQSPNIVVIQAGHFPYKTQKEKWFTELIRHTVAVIAKPIYANQLPNWIHQRAQQLNLSLSAQSLKTVMTFSEGNLLWTNQILMQLAHSDYEQPIQDEVVQAMLADMSVFQIDDLTRALLNKNRQALKITQKLAQENESLVYIATVLFRELDTLKQLLQSGQPFAQACKTLRIWQNKQRDYQTASNHYSLQQLNSALHRVAQLDRINKGQEKGDGWLLLTRIVSDLVLS